MPDPAPNAPRFWWLKRLGILFVVALLALAGLRLYWGHVMSQRLKAAVAAIESRGEPIHFDDMKRDLIPDVDNAAYYLRQALAKWPTVNGTLITESEWYEENWDNGKDHPDPIIDNAAYLAECAEVIALLELAASAPDVDWNTQLVSPAIHILVPHLSESRQIGRLIEDAIGRAHETGNDRLATELLQRLLTLADASEQSPPMLLSHLVSVSIRAMYAQNLEKILPTLHIDPDDPRAASPNQLRQMVNSLLDGEARRQSLAQGYIGERWMVFDTASGVIDGRLSLNSFGGGNALTEHSVLVLFKPLFQYDTLYMLDLQTDMVTASQQVNDLASYESTIKNRQPTDLGDLPTLIHPLSHIMLGSIDSVIQTHFRSQAVLRPAATALAIKLYEHDHGHRPVTLSELVLGYLPEGVPMDPLAPTPREIGYLPEGVQPRMDYVWSGDKAAIEVLSQQRFTVLYSVGDDRDDDGGQCFFEENGTLTIGYSTYTRIDGDEVFHLDPSPEPLLQSPADEPLPDPYPEYGGYPY